MALESSLDLTNLNFTVSFPPERFTNFTITATAPEVGSVTTVQISSTQAVVTLAAQSGQVMRGPKQFAEVCFALLPG